MSALSITFDEAGVRERYSRLNEEGLDRVAGAVSQLVNSSDDTTELRYSLDEVLDTEEGTLLGTSLADWFIVDGVEDQVDLAVDLDASCDNDGQLDGLYLVVQLTIIGQPAARQKLTIYIDHPSYMYADEDGTDPLEVLTGIGYELALMVNQELVAQARFYEAING